MKKLIPFDDKELEEYKIAHEYMTRKANFVCSLLVLSGAAYCFYQFMIGAAQPESVEAAKAFLANLGL